MTKDRPLIGINTDYRATAKGRTPHSYMHSGYYDVILSANVFVAPLRALALARAAAPRVSVRPSRRDPVLTSQLVAEAGDPGIALVSERDTAAIDADVIHVYGRSETIDSVRGHARPGVAIRGHGPGAGVAVVTAGADLRDAARALARDVVTFDQRGCLSPRAAIVEDAGPDRSRARAFAEALAESLADWSSRVPRGALDAEERAASVRWVSVMSFAGVVWEGAGHAVALLHGEASAPLGSRLAAALPPPGRHVAVLDAPGLHDACAFGTLGPFVVAVGTDDPARVSRLVPAHARVSALGRMQRPALDGPVDRR